MRLGPGETFAGYTVVRPIGAGGMGEVYLVEHPRLPKRVALKLLGSAISNEPVFRERFLREANLAARLWHPHIVGVQDCGEDDGQLWIAMDYVDGSDAAQVLARSYPAGLPPQLALPIITAVASALDHAHDHGLLHRDVKPANILLSHIEDPEQRRVLLTDFGIARESADTSGLTQTNMTLGTVAYSPPEQLMGGEVDGRADQYALATTAYHLLTGAPIFPHTNPAAVIGQHLNSAPPRLADTRPDLASLDPVFGVALAKSPANRFARCSDFAHALAEASAGNGSAAAAFAPTALAPVKLPQPFESKPMAPPGPGRRRIPAAIWALAALVAVAAVGAAILVWGRESRSVPADWPTTSTAAASSTVAVPSTVTVSVLPPSTITRTVTPTLDSPSTYSEPPTLPTKAIWPVVIVGTCDEGGSCGVQQRTQPYNSAPRLYPNVLRDGATAMVVCATIGDERSSRGQGSSRVWYQLDNGAYINSVYTTPPLTEIPSC